MDRRTSPVWKFFKLVPASAATNGEPKAECPDCSKKLTAVTTAGTSHLKRHKCYEKWAARQDDMSIYDGLEDIEHLD